MVKKFLRIFKRDKTGFSNEELEWQRKWTRIIAHVWIVISIVLCSITLILIALYSQRYRLNDNVMFAMLIITEVCFVHVYLLVYCHIIRENFYNVLDQMKENSERQQK